MQATQSVQAAPVKGVYPYYLVGLMLCTSVIAYTDRLILGFLIDPIKADLGLSDTEIGLLTGLAFSLFYALMGLPLGRAVDTYPRNRVLAACVAFWSLCTMACGAAVGAVSLFLARCGIGAGEAALNPAAVSLISETYPRSGMVKALAIYSMGVVGGGGVAILLGGQLVAYLHSLGEIPLLTFDHVPAWRLVFMIIGAPGLLLAALILFTVKEPREQIQRPVAKARISFRKSLAFVWHGRAHYFWLLGGLLAWGFYHYAVLGWYPAMFSRTYGVSAADISVGYGSVYLVAGLAAVVTSPMVARYFEERGNPDAVVLVLAIATGISIIPGVLGPLMPTFETSIAMFVLTMLTSTVVTSLAFGALALITLPHCRGTIVACYVLSMNIIGSSVSNFLIGLWSDHIFGAEHLARSIALMAAISLPISTVCFFVVRPHFRKARAVAEDMAGEAVG